MDLRAVVVVALAPLALAACRQGPPPSAPAVPADGTLARADYDLLAQANAAIESEDWDGAERVLEGLLAQDPRCSRAAGLLRLARAGVRIRRAARVDPRGAIAPDREYWLAPERDSPPHDDRGLETPAFVLATRRLTLDFDGVRIHEALRRLADLSGLAVELDRLVDPRATVSLRLHGARLRDALDSIGTAIDPPLVVRVELDRVVLEPPPPPPLDARLDFYDVSDFVASMPDFPRPEISLPPGGGGGGGGVFLFPPPEPPREPWRIDPEKLVYLLEITLGRTWASLEYSGGVLIARTGGQGHAEIARLISALRESVVRGR